MDWTGALSGDAGGVEEQGEDEAKALDRESMHSGEKVGQRGS